MAGRGGGFSARVMQYNVNQTVVDRLANSHHFKGLHCGPRKLSRIWPRKGAQTRDELAPQMKSFSDTFKSECYHKNSFLYRNCHTSAGVFENDIVKEAAIGRVHFLDWLAIVSARHHLCVEGLSIGLVSLPANSTSR